MKNQVECPGHTLVPINNCSSVNKYSVYGKTKMQDKHISVDETNGSDQRNAELDAGNLEVKHACRSDSKFGKNSSSRPTDDFVVRGCKYRKNNPLYESGCDSDNNVFTFENITTSKDKDVSKTPFPINTIAKNKHDLTEAVCAKSNDSASSVFSNDVHPYRELALGLLSPRARGLIDLGKHPVFMDPKTGEFYLQLEGEVGFVENHVNKMVIAHIFHSVSSEEDDLSSGGSERSPLSFIKDNGNVSFRRDSDKSSDYDEENSCGHDFERSVSFDDSEQFSKSLEKSIEHGCKQQIVRNEEQILHTSLGTPNLNKAFKEQSPFLWSHTSFGVDNKQASKEQSSFPWLHTSYGVDNKQDNKRSNDDECSPFFPEDLESSGEVEERTSLSGGIEMQDSIRNLGLQRRAQNNDHQASREESRNNNKVLNTMRIRFPGNYVAWLACAEDDWESFGQSFHSLLEDWGLPIFCELRDLDLGGLYYENITRALEERCNGKIIVVLSKNFMRSEHCLFLTYFAKTLDPETVGNNIIPVAIDKDVEIPSVLSGLALINYNRMYRSGWLKEKLVTAIAS